jgi:hypothetical protein
MMAPKVCDELADLLPAQALDALAAPQRELVAAHTARCADCAREQRELSEVASQLALALPQLEPPPALGARILAEARRDLAPERPLPNAQPGQASGFWTALQRWSAGLSLVAIAVALVALLWGANLQQQLDQSQRQLAETSAQLQGTRTNYWTVARVLASPEVQVRELQAGDAAPGAQGKLWVDPISGRGMMMARELPPPPAGTVYQAWLSDSNGRVCPGFLRANEYGIYYLVLDAPGKVSDYQRVGVTLEPSPGSPGPTGPRVIGGSIGFQ